MKWKKSNKLREFAFVLSPNKKMIAIFLGDDVLFISRLYFFLHKKAMNFKLIGE